VCWRVLAQQGASHPLSYSVRVSRADVAMHALVRRVSSSSERICAHVVVRLLPLDVGGESLARSLAQTAASDEPDHLQAGRNEGADPDEQQPPLHLTNDGRVAAALIRLVTILVVLHHVPNLLHLVLREVLERECDDPEQDLRGHHNERQEIRDGDAERTERLRAAALAVDREGAGCHHEQEQASHGEKWHPQVPATAHMASGAGSGRNSSSGHATAGAGLSHGRAQPPAKQKEHPGKDNRYAEAEIEDVEEVQHPSRTVVHAGVARRHPHGAQAQPCLHSAPREQTRSAW